MKKERNLNKLKIYCFLAGLLVSSIKLIQIIFPFLRENTIVHIADLAAMLCLIFAMSFYAFSVSWGKVKVDEMSKEHELKASHLTFVVLMLAVLVLNMMSHVDGMQVILSSDLLTCFLFVIITLKDGFYLFLERRG